MKKSTLPLQLLILLYMLCSCSNKPSGLVSPQIDQSIAAGDVAITVPVNDVIADNYSQSQISVQIKSLSDIPLNTSVTFTSNRGTFTNGSNSYSVILGTDGTANAYLKNNTAAAVTVTVSIGNYFSKTVMVTFSTALPDQIVLSPDIAIFPNASTATVNLVAGLSRINGTPSIGQALTFTDSTATNGKSVGTFLNISASDASNSVKAQYILQDTTYKGYIYLKAALPTAPLTTFGMTRILIQ